MTASPPRTGPALDRIADAADRLRTARARRVPCPPVRDLIGSTDLRAAYAVQQLLTAVRVEAGARVVGRKVGLTSVAVQRQLSVDQPDYGVLFEDMAFRDGDTVPMARLIQPRVEAEIAFILAEDLDAGDLDLARIRSAIACALPALEVVDSAVSGWDITIADTVADNASSGLYVLGRRPSILDDFDPVAVTMTLDVDGETVSSGSGAACLGDPLRALQWLATTARELGDPLRGGEVVLSGALGPMVPVVSGSRVTARVSPLGTVSATFEGELP